MAYYHQFMDENELIQAMLKDYFARERIRKALEPPKPITLESLKREIDRLRLDKHRMAAAFHRIVGDEVYEVPRKVPPVDEKALYGSMLSKNLDERRRPPPRKPSYIPKHFEDAETHNMWYFDSYDDIVIHHDMVFDHARTEAYRDAIADRAENIKGKSVMDLGCGSGILSMFCAQQGARVVHAIDKSNIIFDAMSNSFENRFDKVIKFHHVDLDNDDTSDLDKEGKVDVLVSEFMGYFLLFEGMTKSFLNARDKYLKPNGILMPDQCMLEIAPLGPNGLYKRKVACWDTAFGFTMPAMKDRVMTEPLMENVNPDEIIGNRVELKRWDLYTCTEGDLFIKKDYEFEFTEDTEFCGIAGYFSVDFNGRNKSITLSTSPWDPSTHWKQTVFFFPKTFTVTKGQKLKGCLKCVAHKDDQRWLIIVLEFAGSKRFMYEMK